MIYTAYLQRWPRQRKVVEVAAPDVGEALLALAMQWPEWDVSMFWLNW